MTLLCAIDIIQAVFNHTKRHPDRKLREEVWNVFIQNALQVAMLLGEEINAKHRIKEARESDVFILSEDSIMADAVLKQILLFVARNDRHKAKRIRTHLLRSADALAKTIDRVPPSKFDDLQDEGEP